MRIPKSIKIGGHIWRIKYPHVFDDPDTFGECDQATKTIYISKKCRKGVCNKSSIIVTLIHEILHAIDYHTGDFTFLGIRGHRRIEALSESFYQILNDNGYLK